MSRRLAHINHDQFVRLDHLEEQIVDRVVAGKIVLPDDLNHNPAGARVHDPMTWRDIAVPVDCRQRLGGCVPLVDLHRDLLATQGDGSLVSLSAA
jgi:hypothetical protein